jgi:hypothetical protein
MCAGRWLHSILGNGHDACGTTHVTRRMWDDRRRELGSAVSGHCLLTCKRRPFDIEVGVSMLKCLLFDERNEGLQFLFEQRVATHKLPPRD